MTILTFASVYFSWVGISIRHSLNKTWHTYNWKAHKETSEVWMEMAFGHFLGSGIGVIQTGAESSKETFAQDGPIWELIMGPSTGKDLQRAADMKCIITFILQIILSVKLGCVFWIICKDIFGLSVSVSKSTLSYLMSNECMENNVISRWGQETIFLCVNFLLLPLLH